MTDQEKSEPTPPAILGTPRTRAVDLRAGGKLWQLKHITEVANLAGGQVRITFDDNTTMTVPAEAVVPVP